MDRFIFTTPEVLRERILSAVDEAEKGAQVRLLPRAELDELIESVASRPWGYYAGNGGTVIIFATDADEVSAVEGEGGYLWQWFEPEVGEEFVPATGAAEYFRSCGRDDIAVVVESGVPYIYGHREQK